VAAFIYLVASIAETNRAPFDLPEAESELVAGYMTEYSGFRWSLYFLGEYANMIVVGSIATTLFLGGWLRPFPNWKGSGLIPERIVDAGWDLVPAAFIACIGVYCVYRAGKQPAKAQTWFMWAVALACLAVAALYAIPALLFAMKLGGIAGSLSAAVLPGLNGAFWFLLKVSGYIYVFMWLRFTLPRYRFDQLMHLGWYILIPLAIVNIFAVGVAMLIVANANWNHGLALTLATILGTVVTLLFAVLLVRWHDRRTESASSASMAPDSYAG
jgi:NADH-quinone oxidoreductase subunit H